ncbi:MAG: hypothetical protein B5M46_03025 [Epsilonproteobacteria bacterium 4484_20]|nr:MAG: hypothetical protein B5M46_03025 [Epsilonproteobacteria bacterium 4484_20]
MTIYQVVYYNQFEERVAEFGFYEDKLDAEKRAFEVRMKAPLKSGKVRIEEIFVEDSSQKESLEKNTHVPPEKNYHNIYDLKNSD